MILRINTMMVRICMATFLIGVANVALEARIDQMDDRDLSSTRQVKERKKRNKRDRNQSKYKKRNGSSRDKNAERYRRSRSADEAARADETITSGYDKTADPLSESAIDATRRNRPRRDKVRPSAMEFNGNKGGRLD